MRARLVTPAVDSVLTLAAAKVFLRVEGSDEDALITDLITSATAHIEQLTGRSICGQEWELSASSFTDEFLLPNGPVRSVEAFTYEPGTGDPVAVDAGLYEVDLVSDPARVLRRSGAVWPNPASSASAVKISYLAGYEAVPAPLRQAVLLLVGHWYTNREAVVTGTIATEIPLGVDQLIHNYRSWTQ